MFDLLDKQRDILFDKQKNTSVHINVRAFK